MSYVGNPSRIVEKGNVFGMDRIVQQSQRKLLCIRATMEGKERIFPKDYIYALK